MYAIFHWYGYDYYMRCILYVIATDPETITTIQGFGLSSQKSGSLQLKPIGSALKYILIGPSFNFIQIVVGPIFEIGSALKYIRYSAANKKNHARFKLQTEKLCTFRMSDLAFGTLRRVSSHRRGLKPIGQLATISLRWPTPCFHALGLDFEHWPIHASAVQRAICGRRHIGTLGLLPVDFWAFLGLIT